MIFPSATPTVTIVTPSYNQGEFIRATIESVLSQDYPQIEYIVMDGGSTDQTPAIVSEYAGRLTWISEKDFGQAHAINKGFRRAVGDVVAWLNSDDILLPGAISRAIHAFAAAPSGTGAIYGNGYLMDREGRITRTFPFSEPFNLWKLVNLSDYILQQSVFFRRGAVEEVGWLDEGLHYALDWELLIRLGKRFGLHYVPEYFGVLREYAEAKSFAGGRRRVEEIRSVLERHSGLKRAPGYWTYRLETFQAAWKQNLECRSPRWLRAPTTLAYLLLRIASTAAVLLVLRNRHRQGLYADRWVGAKLRWMLPRGTGDVIIRGRLPEDPKLVRQTLSVRVAGCEVARWPLEPGPFTLRFSRPTGEQEPFRFEIRSSRYRWSFLRRELTLRRMAWIVEEIGWAHDEGEAGSLTVIK